jgi:hypothetical protein
MNEVKLIDAGPEGSVLFELVMDPKYSNLNGGLSEHDYNFYLERTCPD